MKTSIAVLLLFVGLIYNQVECREEQPLLGRPDGHEPGSQKPVSDDSDNSDDSDADESPIYHYEDEYVNEDADEDVGFLYPDHEIRDDEDDSNDDEDTLSDDDGGEPLVRCKRPLCMMYCENGFEVDSTGCPTCHCKDSNSTLIGRPDGHEPVAVDCEDRPMCEMYCPNGFKSGDDGCPVCECNTDGNLIGRPDGHEGPLIGRPDGHDGNLLGRPDGHEPTVSCKDKPMCRMFCHLGFQTDESGCSVCACLEDPCQGVVCETGSACQSQPCENIHSCTTLSAKCVSVPKSLPCPEPMCANACPNGYKTSDEGCMTCQCVSVPAARICGSVTCDEGQICRNKTDGSPPACSIETLCEIQHGAPVGLGGTDLQCEADGSFKPLQCNAKQADCWCVNGLGEEMPSTRTTVYVDEHKPNCVRNRTLSMHIHMTLVVKHDLDITDQLVSLNSTIVDHVSSWLLIEPHYIKIAKAEPMSDEDASDDDASDDEDESEDADDLDSPRLVIVELIVFHDGQSDLPSAANYMQRRMHQGLCDIPVGSGTLLPNPYTVRTTQHQFEREPEPVEVIGEPDRCAIDTSSWRCWRGVRFALFSVGSVLFFLIVVTLVSSIYRRRKLRRMQFRHQKLTSQVSIENEKNFLADEKSEPIIHDSYEAKDEKLPIA